MTLPLLTDQKESPGVTFAEPDDGRSFASTVGATVYKYGYGALVDPIANPQAYANIFTTAERSTRLTGNMVSESAAREEAYDNRIKTIKAATGIELENPERGGYAIDARKAIRDEVRAGGLQPIDAKGGVPEYQKRLFDQKVAELQKDHPDLQFGDLDSEARTLAKGAAGAAGKAAANPDLNPVASLATEFAGGLVGSRRDPLFIGSLFAGPTSAVGKTALARIASSSLFTGLFNAGLSAVEQPTVQDWRAKIGMEHGVIPAIEDVGLAFVMGAIPGAAVQGLKEGLAKPLGRVLANRAEPGDVEAIRAGLTPDAPREAAALAAGIESSEADRATLTIPAPKDVAPELHDDMLAAALKRADDPSEPSPEAVEAVHGFTPRQMKKLLDEEQEQLIGMWHQAREPISEGASDFHRSNMAAYKRELDRAGIGQARSEEEARDILFEKRGERVKATRSEIIDGEINQRLIEAQPKSEREAVVAADEALDDIGRRESMAVMRDGIDNVKAEQDGARAERIAAETAEPAPKPAKDDPMGAIPWFDAKGKPDTITARQAANLGKREDHMNMVVLGCQA